MRAILILALLATPALADCPKPVTDAVAKAYPKATIKKCQAEGANFEAKLAKPDLELDLAPDGTILQVEEKIAVDKLPDAVKKAFATKYPKAKATSAEKQTAGKKISYEVAFSTDKGRVEATFAEDGTFVEEE